MTQPVFFEPSPIAFDTVARHIRVTVTNVATGLVALIGAANLPSLVQPNGSRKWPKSVTLCVETVDAANTVYFTADNVSTPSLTLGLVVGSMASPTLIPCPGGMTQTVDAIKLVAPAGNTHVQAYFEFGQ